MSKKQWGNATWYLFHTLAEKLKPEYDNPVEIKLLYSIIKKICLNLPCPDCTKHATKILETANENYFTSSKEKFKNFLFQFHNKVNKSVGTREIKNDELSAIYSTTITRQIINNFIYVMNIKSRDLKLSLMKSQNKDAYMSTLIHYLNKNIHKFNY
jgi:hypothetical protein